MTQPDQPGKVLRIRAVLQPRGPAAAVILTDEQVAALGAGKAPAVRVSVGGRSFLGRIGRMGGENLLGFTKRTRADLAVAAGDTIDVEIAVDGAPRQVELPDALAAAFGTDPGARTLFDALAPSHRKEFARWVGEAKREETQQRRVAQTLVMLREGRTR
jgi:hypothetical protein